MFLKNLIFNFLPIDKQENRAYDVQVNYTKIMFVKYFLDYLDPIYFNAIPMFLKKLIFCNGNKKI